MSNQTDERMEAQKKEFDTLLVLLDALMNLPPIVDDDYPRARAHYEASLKEFLIACGRNKRFKQVEIAGVLPPDIVRP